MHSNKKMINTKIIDSTIDSIGDWNGNEQIAYNNINKIRWAIYNNASNSITEEELFELFKIVWDHLGSDKRLLSITEPQINEYIKSIM